MVKEQDDISPDRTYVAPHDVELLRKALIHALSVSEAKLAKKNPDTAFEPIVHQPHVPVQVVTADLLARLHRENRLYLDRYFLDSRSHSEQIAKFLSILELMKVHVVALWEPDLTETDVGAVVDLADHVALILEKEPDAELLEALTEYA